MEKLVSHLIKTGVLKTPAIVEAFRAVDRKDFVLPEFKKGSAYADEPLPIGFGQTISQPFTVAFMLELLQPKDGQNILDVGSGSGWQTGLLAEIAGEHGRVDSLEIIPELLEFSKSNLEKYRFRNIAFMNRNARDKNNGLKKYDRVVVAAAAESVPKSLFSALAIGGRMVLPISSPDGCDLVLVEKKSDSKFSETHFPGFAFVPLVKDR